MTRTERRTSGRTGERGVAAVLVAISLTALCGVGALAVDAGNTWQSRRGLITAADAAALAAAQQYALGDAGCDDAAPDYVTRNVPAATMTRCDVTISGTAGSVTVEATETVDYVLAGVFGVADQQVRASTTVRWGVPASAHGLRPFGLCIEGEQDFMDWLADPSTVEVIKITYGKNDNAAACNGGDSVPGNWGMIDFNGGSNASSETQDWIQNGYDGAITAGTWGGDCDTEPEACYEGNTGSFANDIQGELQSLVDSGDVFALPLFDKVTGNGAGSLFHLVGFVKARLIDFKANGVQSGRYLTLEFQPGIIEGSCCDASSVDTGLRVIEICAVDPNDQSGC